MRSSDYGCQYCLTPKPPPLTRWDYLYLSIVGLGFFVLIFIVTYRFVAGWLHG